MLVLSCLPLLVAGFFFFLVYPFSDGVGLQETELWCWVGVIMSQDLFSLLPQPRASTVLVSAYVQKLLCHSPISETDVLCCQFF